MNLVIWDIESSSASTDFGSIIEIGGILVDENQVKFDNLLTNKEYFRTKVREAYILLTASCNKSSSDQNVDKKDEISASERIEQQKQAAKWWRGIGAPFGRLFTTTTSHPPHHHVLTLSTRSSASKPRVTPCHCVPLRVTTPQTTSL